MGIIIGILASLGTYFGVKTISFAETVNELLFELKLNRKGIKFKGLKLVLPLIVKFTNPLTDTIQIDYPFVKLFYKGSSVANSNPESGSIKIQGKGKNSFDNIKIEIPLMSLISVIPDFSTLIFGLIQDIKAKNPQNTIANAMKLASQFEYEVRSKANGIDFVYAGGLV